MAKTLALALAACALLLTSCSPSPPSGKAVPTRPAKHVDFPAIKDWRTLRIGLSRTMCFGSCPDYVVQIRADGTVTYDGRYWVAINGHHTARISQGDVRKLVDAFRAASFFRLQKTYRAPVTDMPTNIVAIEYDNHRKMVLDYAGDDVGMPRVVGDLQRTIDRIARTEKWVRGNAETIPALRAEGWDFRGREDDHVRLIASATRVGRWKLAMQLLDAGVRVSGVGARYGCEALSWSVMDRAPLEMLKALLHAGAQLRWAPKEPDPDIYPCDALEEAAGRSEPAVVALFLSRHPDVRHANGQGETVLHALAGSAGEELKQDGQDSVRILQMFLDAGADINARDNEGQTPLMLAARKGGMVRALLNVKGVEVDARDRFGQTPLMQAVMVSSAQALLAAGADIHAKDSSGRTVLDVLKADESRYGVLVALEDWIKAHPSR